MRTAGDKAKAFDSKCVLTPGNVSKITTTSTSDRCCQKTQIVSGNSEGLHFTKAKCLPSASQRAVREFEPTSVTLGFVASKVPLGHASF